MRTTLIGISISLSVMALSAQAQAPTFTAASVLNAASMTAGPIAAGMVVAITGKDLGSQQFPGACMRTTPVPATCTAVTVLVNGSPAPKLFDSASEVTFQAPFNLSGSSATIQVTSTLSGSTLSSETVTVPVAPVSPGIYTAGGTGSGTGYYYDLSQSGLTQEYSQPVQPGDTVILFATGFGATTPAVATGVLGPTPGAAASAAVTLSINNQPVTATFAGLEPGNQSGAQVGYDEVVFTVPAGLTIPTGQPQGAFPVKVTVGGTASNTVNLLVGPIPTSITSVNPNPVGVASSPQTVTFTGTGFQNGLTLAIEPPPPSTATTMISGSDITFLSSTQFSAVITVGTVGSWSVAVTNPDGTQTSAFSFTVAPASITRIVTTSSGVAEISQNSWIEVHGEALSIVTTTWSNSDFSNGLPTTLAGVSATVDNMPATIFYVSPTQVNLLAPLDSAAGMVSVQLTTPSGTATATATEVQTSPALLVIDTTGHVAAEHTNGSLLGPSSLDQPGYTFTPATPGETVAIYTTGFGQTNPAFTNQLKNTGLTSPSVFPLSLPTLPTVTIGNLPATVSYAALVSPGLYQLNVVVPASAPAGDLPIVAMYGGVSTQSTAVITVQ